MTEQIVVVFVYLVKKNTNFEIQRAHQFLSKKKKKKTHVFRWSNIPQK